MPGCPRLWGQCGALMEFPFHWEVGTNKQICRHVMVVVISTVVKIGTLRGKGLERDGWSGDVVLRR